ELKTPLTKEQVSVYGEVESIEGKSVRLLVKRDGLTATVAKILADWEVLDLQVSEPPIEEVIGRVFRTGVVS
ncbi:MAG: ABC transporter, partial [Microcoleaceae cyanobacterium]